MNTLDKSLSLYIDGLLPKHIAENNPQLVTFIKKYYDWAEENGNVNNVLHQFADTTNESFVDSFYDLYRAEYVPFYPEQTPIDKALFIKVIRAVYMSKGTPDSIRFFFRSLFNETVDIIYPIERSLLAIPRQKVLIKIAMENMTYGEFRWIQGFSKQFISAGEGSKAFVEDLTYYFTGPGNTDIDPNAPNEEIFYSGQTIFELRLSNVRNIVQFQPAARLFLFGAEFEDENDPNFQSIIQPFENVIIQELQDEVIGDYYLFGYSTIELDSQLGNYEVLSAGTGYAVGDIINISPELSLVQARAKVLEVDEFGGIVRVQIDDSGVMYSFDTITNNITSVNGSGASIKFIRQGFFDTTLNDTTTPTEQYQYTIRSSLPERTWGQLLTQTFHPAGVKYTGELFVFTDVTEVTSGTSLQLYSRDLRFGGVNKPSTTTASSREFFYPQINLENSFYVYNPFQRFVDENTLFSTDIIDFYKDEIIADFELTPIIAFGTYKDKGEFFDPNRAIRYGDFEYTFGTGKFAEFPEEYFDKDIQVRSEPSFGINPRVILSPELDLGEPEVYVVKRTFSYGKVGDLTANDAEFLFNLVADGSILADGSEIADGIS